jgi:chemotaxis protein MotB
MRTILSASLITCILGSLILAGGCVSQGQYDALAAQNRNAQAELQRVMAALDEANSKYRSLEQSIANLQAQLEAKDKTITLLSGGREDLMAKIKELQDALAKAGQGMDATNVIALPAALDKALAALANANPTIFDYDAKRGMLKFKSDMTFDPGEDTIRPDAKNVLSKLAEILNTPEAATFHAYVAGHTDDLPISKPETKRRHPTNWYLSVHRSVAVEGVLEKAGVKAERLAAMGFGEYHPIAPNAAGNKGNVANRRVEIWIVPPSRFMTVEGARAQ